MTETHIAGPSPIRLCRLIRGLSQRELAERAGIRRETISRLERGAQPHLRTAQALADVFGVDAIVLFPQNDTTPAARPGLVTTSPRDGGRFESAG